MDVSVSLCLCLSVKLKFFSDVVSAVWRFGGSEVRFRLEPSRCIFEEVTQLRILTLMALTHHTNPT